MICNSKKKMSEIEGSNNLVPDGLIQSIKNYISIHIKNFKINYEQISETDIEQSYNNQLSSFFNANLSNEIFQFQHEYQRENSRKPDIAVLIKELVLKSDYLSIFDIECKRLNTKLSHVKQYVSEETGGIERFKKNLHGTDLSHSAMIAYVETETFDFWFQKINSWIDKEITKDNSFWNETDYLFKNNNKLYSKHLRHNKTAIELQHFWIDISKQDSN